MNNQSSIKMTNKGFEVRNDIGELIASISSDDGEIEVFNGKSYTKPKTNLEENHSIKNKNRALNLTSRGLSTYVNKPKTKKLKQISKIIFNLTRLALTIFITVKQYKSYKETI